MSGIEVTKEVPCLKNEAKYEALVVGLKAAKRLGIRRLKVFEDS